MTPSDEAQPIGDYKTIESLVGTKQYELVRGGMSQSAARDLAVEEIGKMLDTPMTGEALETWLATERGKCAKVQTDTPVPADAERGTVSDLYLTWLGKHDHIGSDGELAHFIGVTDSAIYHARKRAEQMGYVLKKGVNGNGYTVAKRPAAKQKRKVYTQEEVTRMMEDLLNRYGKVE